MLQEHVPGERRARPGLGPGVTGQGRSAAPLQNSRHIRRLRQRPRGTLRRRALRGPTGPAQPPPLSCLPGLTPQGRGSGPWLSALHPVAQKMGRMIPARGGERGDVRRGRGPAHRREDPRRPRCPAAVGLRAPGERLCLQLLDAAGGAGGLTAGARRRTWCPAARVSVSWDHVEHAGRKVHPPPARKAKGLQGLEAGGQTNGPPRALGPNLLRARQVG